MISFEEKLRNIEDDDDFVFAVTNQTKHPEDRKIVIQFIDKNENVTYENLLLLALSLKQKRRKNERNQD